MTIWSSAKGAGGGGRRMALWALCAALPLLQLGYQIAAKETALALAGTALGPAWVLKLVQIPWAQGLLVLEAFSFAAWMVVLSQMKLSAAFPLTAIGYLLVIGAGWGVFHEPATLLQGLGGAVILCGVWLIGRSEPEPG